jgi:tetratricopeptide (TPR) repeat protein
VGPLAFVVAVILVQSSSSVMANWYKGRATEKVRLGDFDGALANLDTAIEWSEDDPALYRERGRVRSLNKDWEGAESDFDHLVELSPEFVPGRIERGQLYLQRGRYDEAIQEFGVAIRESPPDDHYPLNDRAYARALAGKELEAGLFDIEMAIELYRAQNRTDNSAYLDTRGYLHFLLKNPEAALKDLDRAVKMMEAEHVKTLNDAREAKVGKEVIQRLEKAMQEQRSVVLHHRGEAHQALGDTEQADADLKQADALGYDPEGGVF